METCLLYVTVPTRDLGLSLARLAVDRRLAACGNVIGGMHAVYRWQGRVCEDEEAVLILKTRRERVEELVATLREAHPDQCPCMVALPIAGGHQPFLDWIGEQTGTP